MKLGQFKVDVPLPWELHKAILHPGGIKPPSRMVPPTLAESNDKQSLIFEEKVRKDENGDDAPICRKFESVWLCPGPELGEALIIVNYRLRDQKEWLRLTHSLKESATRCEFCFCTLNLVYQYEQA